MTPEQEQRLTAAFTDEVFFTLPEHAQVIVEELHLHRRYLHQFDWRTKFEHIYKREDREQFRDGLEEDIANYERQFKSEVLPLLEARA